MEYKLVIDQAVIDEYNAVYKKLHPQSRKPALDKPIMPGLNQMLIMKRPQMAALKAKLKEFGIWLVKKYGYENLQLDKFEVKMKIFFGSRRKFDLDNYGAGIKGLLDPFKESGFITEDNYMVMTKFTVSGGYDKENPRTEILFRTIEETSNGKE